MRPQQPADDLRPCTRCNEHDRWALLRGVMVGLAIMAPVIVGLVLAWRGA